LLCVFHYDSFQPLKPIGVLLDHYLDALVTGLLYLYRSHPFGKLFGVIR
tara:strand:+ start:165 stop:311 length:147 start_codon:yes stop_codon:yes gene_type:complete